MGEQYMKETGGSMGLKRVNGAYGYVDSMLSLSVLGEQHVVFLKNVMGEQHVKQTGGNLGLRCEWQPWLRGPHCLELRVGQAVRHGLEENDGRPVCEGNRRQHRLETHELREKRERRAWLRGLHELE
jgi:hypothetical protein